MPVCLHAVAPCPILVRVQYLQQVHEGKPHSCRYLSILVRHHIRIRQVEKLIASALSLLDVAQSPRT